MIDDGLINKVANMITFFPHIVIFDDLNVRAVSSI